MGQIPIFESFSRILGVGGNFAFSKVANMPAWEKIGLDLGLTAKIREKWPSNRKTGHSSPIFCGEAKSIFRRCVFYLGPEARTDFLPGGHVRNSKGKLGSQFLARILGVGDGSGEAWLVVSHGQTAHSSRKPRAGTPSRAGTPCPLLLPKEVQKGWRGPGRKGCPGSKGGRGPGSWCSLAYTGSRSVGIPRAGSPSERGGPLAFSQWGSFKDPHGMRK